MTTLPDPRNADIKVYVGGRIVPRAEARVSVFDSVVQGGDAVWEGIRVYDSRIFQLDAHLDRLFASAKAMAFAAVPARETVKQAIFDTLEANGMQDGAHIRLTLTRGEKVTSGMDPKWNRSGPTLIVLAEWKPPVYPEMIRLVTASIRRNSPQALDSKIHHANLINNILAKIEANVAGADDALMLDFEGYVAETNATNVFIVRKGVLETPHADYCLPGITRAVVLELGSGNGIATAERRLSLTDIYTADEMFTSGTMGELVPVYEVDGRTIGDGKPGPLTRRIQTLFAEKVKTEGEPLPF
ncbi:MAG TPA: aminotransferase class IV [Rhodothermales bacterium]|nr:aminotransferase class IV [Rhodothermales bacterium]